MKYRFLKGWVRKLTVNDFFAKGKEMAARYKATKEALEKEIKQKEIAIAIEDKLRKAIVSADTTKLFASIDVENLPSFGFDEEQKSEMIQDVCNTIRSRQYTLGDYIALKNEKIGVIRETLVGGVEELFDETDREYKYKKELEEERRNLMLISMQIASMSNERESFPDSLKEIVESGDEMRKKLKYAAPVRTIDEKFGELKAALTGYAIMKEAGAEINNEKAAENFARIRVNIDNGENLFENLENNFAATFEDAKQSFPNLAEEFDNIKESFFEKEKGSEIEKGSEKEPEKNPMDSEIEV